MVNFFSSPTSNSNSNHFNPDSASLESLSIASGDDSSDTGDKQSSDSLRPQQQQQKISTTISEDYNKNKQDKKRLKKLKRQKENPPEKRAQRATDRRRELLAKKKVEIVTAAERDQIERSLGVDADGYCLRHDDQPVRSGIVTIHRFEGIKTCHSCAMGDVSGIKHKHHGKTAKPVKGVYKGVKKGLGLKKKKNKGAYDIHAAPNANYEDTPHGSDNGEDIEPASSRDDEDDFEVEGKAVSIDEQWKEEVYLRVAQVLGWDNNTVPLKCHPLYARYFRMLRKGIPLEEIRETLGDDGPDLLILSLDPNKAFAQQLDGLSPYVQERLRSSAANISKLSDNPAEITEEIYQAYSKQKALFDRFLKEEIAKDAGGGGGEVSDRIDMNNIDDLLKKKKKLRLTKHLKRIVKKKKGVDSSNKSVGDESLDDDEYGMESNLFDDDANPKVAVPRFDEPIMPMKPQTSNTALRRARRPQRASSAVRRGRSPGSSSLGSRTGRRVSMRSSESPKSSISPSPRRSNRPLSQSKLVGLIESSPIVTSPFGEQKQDSTGQKIVNPPAQQKLPKKSSMKSPVVTARHQTSTRSTDDSAVAGLQQKSNLKSSTTSPKYQSLYPEDEAKQIQHQESVPPPPPVVEQAQIKRPTQELDKLPQNKSSSTSQDKPGHYIRPHEYKKCMDGLVEAKQNLQKTHNLLSSTQKQLEKAQEENREMDKRIQDLVKTVSHLQKEGQTNGDSVETSRLEVGLSPGSIEAEKREGLDAVPPLAREELSTWDGRNSRTPNGDNQPGGKTLHVKSFLGVAPRGQDLVSAPRMSSNSLEPPEPPVFAQEKVPQRHSDASDGPMSLSEKRRKKRELEERLRLSKSKSGDLSPRRDATTKASEVRAPARVPVPHVSSYDTHTSSFDAEGEQDI